MPDQEKSIRPPVARVLRESFLSLFHFPDQEAALRLLDEVFYHLTLEGRNDHLMPKEHAPGRPDPITRGEVLAAAGDLRQAADQLRESAQGMMEACHENREGMRAAVAIADASAAVQPIADQLDAALAVYLAAPEGK